MHTPPAAKLCPRFLCRTELSAGQSPLRALERPCTVWGSSHPKAFFQWCLLPTSSSSFKKRVSPYPFGCDDNPLKRSRMEPCRSCSWTVPEVHRRPGFPCAVVVPSFLSLLRSAVCALKAQIQGLPFLCFFTCQRMGRKQFARKAFENGLSISCCRLVSQPRLILSRPRGL